jgi:hypothetical protein
VDKIPWEVLALMALGFVAIGTVIESDIIVYFLSGAVAFIAGIYFSRLVKNGQ